MRRVELDATPRKRVAKMSGRALRIGEGAESHAGDESVGLDVEFDVGGLANREFNGERLVVAETSGLTLSRLCAAGAITPLPSRQEPCSGSTEPRTIWNPSAIH